MDAVKAHVENLDGFAPIPEPLLYDPALSSDAVRVYGVLRRHGDDPTNCYPSQSRIAALIGKSPRSINGWLRQLEDAGWIERVRRYTPEGDPDTNGYRVHMRAVQRGVHAGERGPYASDSVGGYTLHSAINESHVEREPLNERSTRAVALSSVSFDEFWELYPRKVGKPAAKRAFTAACKRVDERKLLEALRAHAVVWRSWPVHRQQFVPHPSTWLNRDGWDDPIEQHAPQSSRRDEQIDSISQLVDNVRGFAGFDDARQGAIGEG